MFSKLDFEKPWYTFAKWKIYGNCPLVYANMAGQPIIVLSSNKVVKDLLIHRAAKYSDRCKLLVGGYMMGDLALPFTGYTE
ncbi:hypothetical protein K435DRAFT_909109, partial [Dendrothele bispora CBS 962.96]